MYLVALIDTSKEVVSEEVEEQAVEVLVMRIAFSAVLETLCSVDFERYAGLSWQLTVQCAYQSCDKCIPSSFLCRIETIKVINYFTLDVANKWKIEK